MKRLLLICLILPVFAKAQIITTIAGRGISGFSGDGALADSAKMTVPVGIARDKYGNIYFSDNNNNRVRKVDTAGIITTFAGNGVTGFLTPGPATATGLYSPTGVVADTAGNVYIADFLDGLVLKVNTAGYMSIFAGKYDSSGYNGDGIAATAAKLWFPNDVAIDKAGNVYIADQTNDRIRKVNTAGIITTFAGNGTTGYSGDGGPATIAALHNPQFLTLDKMGNVYYSDGMNVVRKIDTAGMITTFAGKGGTTGFSGDGGPADSAEMNNPRGLYADTLGRLFISDASNNRIRVVDTSGTINSFAGTGSPGFSGDGGAPLLAEMNYPMGITGNGSGTLYFADGNNRRLRKITGRPVTTQLKSINQPGKINIFPNPVTDMLNVGCAYKIVQLDILNLEGRVIKTNVFNSDHVQLAVSTLPSGVYFLKINGHEAGKFMKE